MAGRVRVGDGAGGQTGVVEQGGGGLAEDVAGDALKAAPGEGFAEVALGVGGVA